MTAEGPVALQAAHRPELGPQPSVITLDPIAAEGSGTEIRGGFVPATLTRRHRPRQAQTQLRRPGLRPTPAVARRVRWRQSATHATMSGVAGSAARLPAQ
jgi:hypothetical protein